MPSLSFHRAPALAMAVTALCLLPTGAAHAGSAAPADMQQEIAGMQVVDCLLPGQLRRLGTGTFLTPRRPVRTTAADCNIRGGEYTAYDRADYRSALDVWLPAAEAGDAEAQVNVGMIFEKGLGTEPNYPAAAIWYRKAAEQGNRRGQFNLGTLYEQGLGVEKNQLAALDWYRRAWGLPEDSLVFRSMAEQEQAALREELRRQAEDKNQQIELLRRQIDALQQQLQSSAAQLQTATAQQRAAQDGQALQRQQEQEIDQLQKLVASLQTQRQEVETRLAGLPVLRAPQSETAPAPVQVSTAGQALATRVRDLNFGKYYALVVGNRDYRAINDLDTSLNDAGAIAAVLKSRYGFEVQLLLDTDRLTLMRTVNELNQRLGENDNLLIYYAGHGSRISSGAREAGYWLPVDADPPPNDAAWVANEFITDHLGRVNARRAIVIADSCYAGLLSTSPGMLFTGQGPDDSEEYLRYKLPRRARLLLTSGGDQPVIDNGGDGHSVFARVLLDTLQRNADILSAPELFLAIRDEVARLAAANRFEQKPVYKIIKGAGHETGDFFFVPTELAGR